MWNGIQNDINCAPFFQISDNKIIKKVKVIFSGPEFQSVNINRNSTMEQFHKTNRMKRKEIDCNRTVSCHCLKILITFEKLMSDYRSLITNNNTFQSILFIDHNRTYSIDANIFKLTTLAHMSDVSEDDPCKEKNKSGF